MPTLVGGKTKSLQRSSKNTFLEPFWKGFSRTLQSFGEHCISRVSLKSSIGLLKALERVPKMHFWETLGFQKSLFGKASVF